MSQPWLPDRKFPTSLVLPELQLQQRTRQKQSYKHESHRASKMEATLFFLYLCTGSAIKVQVQNVLHRSAQQVAADSARPFFVVQGSKWKCDVLKLGRRSNLG